MSTKNILKEAILKDHELGEAVWNEYQNKAIHNPVYTKLLKEGLYSDVAGALGAVQDVVWAAAQPKTIGREIIKVIPTKNALERFPKDIRAYAWVGEGPPRGTGPRVETQDVKADLNLQAKKEWTESFVEDASWDVLQWQVEGIGRALARLETEKVVKAYSDVSAGNLAGTIDIAADAMTWANVCDLLSLVQREDFDPSVIALHPYLYQDLMKLDQFIHALYQEERAGIHRKGVVHHTTLDVTFVCSSLLPHTAAGANATIGYAIDLDAAGVMLLRRDVITKPYEDPSRNMYGVMGTERIGVGILRTKAVARIRATRG